MRKRRIYPLGVSRARLEQVIRELNVPAVVSRDERDADALLTIKSMYRKQPDRVDAAQASGLPVFVLRSGGMDRLRETLAEMFHVERKLPLTGADADGDEDVRRRGMRRNIAICDASVLFGGGECSISRGWLAGGEGLQGCELVTRAG